MLMTRIMLLRYIVVPVLFASTITACGMDAAAPISSIPSANSSSISLGAASITKISLLRRDGAELATLTAPFTLPAGGPTAADLESARSMLVDGSLEARMKDATTKRLLQKLRVLVKHYEAKDVKAHTTFIQANFPAARRSEARSGFGSVVTIAAGPVDVLKYWTTDHSFAGRRSALGPESIRPPISPQECYEEQCTATCDMNGCDGYTYADVEALMSAMASLEGEVATMVAGIDLDPTAEYVDIGIQGQNCNGQRIAVALATLKFLADVAAVSAAYNSGPVGWVVAFRLWASVTASYGAVGLSLHYYWQCKGI